MLHTNTSKLILFNTIQSNRFNRGLTHPNEVYKFSSTPDVCLLMDKVAGCASKESAYEWFDEFRRQAKDWKVAYKSDDKEHLQAKGKDRNRGQGVKSSLSNSGSSGVSSSQSHRQSQSQSRGVKRGRQDDDDGGENSACLDPTSRSDGLDLSTTVKDDVNTGNTLLYKCRFAHALNVLEKSGIVRLSNGGNVVGRQIYTWLSNE